jgi:glycerol uptake facilitator-like aquaporin
MTHPFSEKELHEIHGEEVDIEGRNGTNKSHTNFGYNTPGESHMSPNYKTKLGSYNFNDLIKAYLVEFSACVIFMLIENYAGGNLQIAVFGVFILITTLYPVSGANMNACVSLSLWYYEEEFVKVHIYRRFGYILIIQPLGILVGQIISLGVVGPNLIYLRPRDTDPFKIAFCEFFWTGCLIFIALHSIVSRYTRPNKDIALNFAFFFCFFYYISLAGANFSGSSYNPTKYLVNQSIAYIRGVEVNAFKNWYCYIFPQFLGTVVFTFIFKYLFEPTYYRMISLKYRWEDKFYPEKYE